MQNVELVIRESGAGAERQGRGGQKTHTEGLRHLSLLLLTNIRSAFAPGGSSHECFHHDRKSASESCWVY